MRAQPPDPEERRELGAGPANVDRNKPMVGLLEHVQNGAGARSVLAAADAVAVVFSSLLMGVDEPLAQRFVAGMPPTLRALLHGSAYDRNRRAAVGDFDGAITRIAASLRIGPDQARELAGNVMVGAAIWLPRSEMMELKGALPSSFDELFRHLT